MMSFQGIASEVGIKKPSIVHHFSTRAEPGVAIIRRYRDTFAAQLQEISEDPANSPEDALEFHFSPYRILLLAQTKWVFAARSRVRCLLRRKTCVSK